jgi:hypothetical protein
MAAAPIAHTILYASRAAQPRRKVVVSIGPPKRSGKYGVACRVKFQGLVAPRDVIGEDSMQAVALAMMYVQLRIRYLLDERWKFYLSEQSKQPVDLLQIWFPYQSMPRWRSNTSLERSRGR